ncbi:hypothetical protein V6M85_13765 [Sulfolobus tengchongensis]|uniref:Uncharacterized protein n=1 Tax=Sulfolobus tengchongensis TaxID=207809 RepID=A0AAX4L144_9CREN
MALQVVQMGDNSPVSEEDLIFLINMLDQSDREEFAEEFVEDLETMLSKSGLYKILSGRIHLSNTKILQIVESNDRARKWLANKIREKMKEAERILAKMEAEMK